MPLNPRCSIGSLLFGSAVALWLSTPALAVLGNDRFELAATETRLWLIESGTRESRCFTRTAETPDQFDVLNINGSIVQAVAIEDTLLVLFDDQRIFQSTDDAQWRPIRQLSNRRRPTTLVAQDGDVFAVVDHETALQFPLASRPPGPAGTLTSAWLDQLPPQWWLVQRSGHSWRRVTPSTLPVLSSNTIQRAPQFVRTNTHYVFAARDTEGSQISTAWIPIESPAQSEQDRLAVTGVTQHWLLETNRQLYLLISSKDPTADSVQLYRAASESNAESRWLPVELSLPDLILADITRAIDAVSFNQHLAILVEDRERNAKLSFWLPTGQSTEATFDVAQRIADRDIQAKRGVTIHMIVTIIPLTLLGVTLAFRHQALRTLPPLSPLVTQAMFSQRLLAALIDLLPFVWAMAMTLDLQVGAAFADLIEWSFAGSESDHTAPTRILVWWGASLVSHAVYMAIIESITGRSVGKVLTRTRVVTTTLEQPTRGQLILRNLTRPFELLPPWPLVIVVVLTLKRQRIGDTWAGTMVVTARRPGVTPPNHTVNFDKGGSATDQQTPNSEQPVNEQEAPSSESPSDETPSDDKRKQE